MLPARLPIPLVNAQTKTNPPHLNLEEKHPGRPPTPHPPSSLLLARPALQHLGVSQEGHRGLSAPTHHSTTPTPEEDEEDMAVATPN